MIRKEFSWTRNQVRWARDKLIESGIISYSGGEKGKNGQYAFTEKVLRASHAQDARNSHALSALTDDSLQTPAEREEERSESVLSEESTSNSCATHAQVTRKPRARTLYINKTIQDKTKHKTHRLSKDNLSVKLTDASSESVDFAQSLKNKREVSSEGKAEENQKSGSTVETLLSFHPN